LLPFHRSVVNNFEDPVDINTNTIPMGAAETERLGLCSYCVAVSRELCWLVSPCYYVNVSFANFAGPGLERPAPGHHNSHNNHTHLC